LPNSLGWALHHELMFPADDESDAFLQALAHSDVA
jgi:hypothetical protein